MPPFRGLATSVESRETTETTTVARFRVTCLPEWRFAAGMILDRHGYCFRSQSQFSNNRREYTPTAGRLARTASLPGGFGDAESLFTSGDRRARLKLLQKRIKYE